MRTLSILSSHQTVVQHVQFVEDEKDICGDATTASESCSFLDKSLEKFINEEKKIIKKVSNTFDSTREWTLRHFNSLPDWMQDNEVSTRSSRCQLILLIQWY